jgi:protocatechuate 3,4-dioxygenase, alpha subunit
MALPVAPSQTLGPFFSIGLPWPDGELAVTEGTPGAFRISGRVIDGAGDPVPDAMVELWQADPHGNFGHPDDPRGGRSTGFRGFARCPTDALGKWFALTVKPGRFPAPDGSEQAPHIAVSVMARGILTRLATRIYFEDEQEANDRDPVLSSLPEERRSTLIATRVDDGYHFDVHLQGELETVFFDV